MAFLQTRRQQAGFLVALLGVALAIALAPFATGLLGIVVLYVICAPAHRRLSRRIPERASAVIVLTAALVVVLLPLAVMVSVMVAEAPAAVDVLQANADRLSSLRIGGMEVGTQLASAGGTAAAWVSEQAFGFFGGAAKSLLSLVIAFFGLYYLLLYPHVVWNNVREYVPFSDGNADALRARFFSVTQATLVGTALTALLQGTMVGVAFWVLGLPGPLFWGVITGMVSVLPMLGSALVWVPGMVVLGMDGRWGAMLALGVVGFLAGSVDNVVRMVVFKKVSNIHPLATLVGAFAGLKLFGLLGVLLGPLAIAYFFELLKMYRAEYAGGAAGPDATVIHPPAPAVIVQAPD
ncbi:MAG TPA: AI-2E family transporter [Longimicrobium sp.]|nr:AI-2E family transporter [Longimicrobium sp.]